MHQQPLYMCFVDFKKAFDSISHDKLWVTMMDMRYPLHFIDLLEKLYRKQLAKVKVAGTLSEWFRVKKGVRQGWRKGLRRILSLPYNTHSRLISPVCDFLPVREELICRCASFIIKCLNSCNSVVHSVSRRPNGIYGMRMHSPIVANVQFCCNYYGMSPNDIPYVNKRLAWTVL